MFSIEFPALPIALVRAPAEPVENQIANTEFATLMEEMSGLGPMEAPDTVDETEPSELIEAVDDQEDQLPNETDLTVAPLVFPTVFEAVNTGKDAAQHFYLDFSPREIPKIDKTLSIDADPLTQKMDLQRLGAEARLENAAQKNQSNESEVASASATLDIDINDKKIITEHFLSDAHGKHVDTTLSTIRINAAAQHIEPTKIIAQLTEAIEQRRENEFEIRLNPQELGKIKLEVKITDGAPLIVLQAERGETLDLMRRHISMLRDDLVNLGFGGAGFEFRENHPQKRATEYDLPEDIWPATPPSDTKRLSIVTGLDIRL